MSIDRKTIERIAAESRGRSPATGMDRVLDALETEGVALDWRTFQAVQEVVGRRAHAGVPQHVTELIGEYARQAGVRTVLDPYAAGPSLIAGVATIAGASASAWVPYPALAANAARIVGADVAWTPEATLASLADAEGAFDLVVCDPPWGVRSSELPVPAGVTGKLEASWLMLYAARRVLRPGGRALFVLADGFAFRSGTRQLRAAMAADGFHVEAMISVADISLETRIAGSIVIAGHTAVEQLFIGRQRKGMRPDRLARNAVEWRAGRRPQLGALVDPVAFRGWAAYASELAVDRELDALGMPVVRLAEVASKVRSHRRERTDAADAIWVPPHPTGTVQAEPPSVAGARSEWIEVLLDPERASAQFVALCLNSELGRSARASVAVGLVPALSLTSVGEVRIPLPPLGAQRRIVQAELALRDELLELEELRRALFRDRAALERAERRVEAGASERWLESLPFPLAALAHRYEAVASPRDKTDMLAHLLESVAQLLATLMLSAARRDDELFDTVVTRLAASEGAPLSRPTFDTWIHAGSVVAKAIRRMESGDGDGGRDLQLRSYLFATDDQRVVDRLKDKSLWDALRRARDVRNQRAHGGLETDETCRDHLNVLHGVLADLRPALRDVFDACALVLPGVCEIRESSFEFVTAQWLVGPNPVFSERRLRSLSQIASDALCCVPASGEAETPLQLIPFVRITADPGGGAAAYFFRSRERDGTLRYVSYQLGAAPELALHDSDTAALVEQFCAGGG